MAKDTKLEVQPVIGFYHARPRIGDFDGSNPTTGEIQPSMTKQEFVAECDINNIVKEYLVTEQWKHVSAKAQQGAYVDLPDPLDFQESIAIVERAGQLFQELPSKVRDRFGNQPGAFLDFMANPTNEKEARDLGLLKPLPEAPAPVEVIIKDAPGSASSPPGASGGSGGSAPVPPVVSGGS